MSWGFGVGEGGFVATVDRKLAIIVIRQNFREKMPGDVMSDW